jgi:hypothetical protein
LNVTVLVPWDVPKLVPLMVTDVPTAAEVGVRLVMLSVAHQALDEARDSRKRTASCQLFLSLMFQSPFLSLNRFATLADNQKQSIQGTARNAPVEGYVMVTASAPPARDEVNPLPWLS